MKAIRLGRRDALGIYQTRTGAPDGNCYAACVATIFGVSLDEIDTDARRWPRDVPWWAPNTAGTPEQRTAQGRIEESWARFFAGYGVTALRLDWRTPRGVTIGMVENVRGIGHAVVCFDGAIVFDPNPLQDSYECRVVDHEVYVSVDPIQQCSDVLHDPDNAGDEDADYDPEDDLYCARCGGEGEIHDCGDDSCACGGREMVPCPDCGGAGR